MNEFAFKYYCLALTEPYRWAKGVQHERCGLLVRCSLEGGVGFGEIAPPPHEPVVEASFRAEAAKVLSGLNLASDNFLSLLDQREPSARLRCGISSAWLSAKAAATGVSLSAYLAKGQRKAAAAVPVNALITASDPKQLRECAREALASGIKTIKVKCVGEHESDIARVRALRSLSKELKIRLDPNGVWDRARVLDLLNDFSAYQIEYVEQPLPADTNIDTWRWLKRASPIKIALDESSRDLETIRTLLEARAASHLILKPQRLGGPDKVFAAIKLAEEFEVACTITGSLETAIGTSVGLHCAALIQEPIPAAGFGTARYFEKGQWPELQIKDGMINIGGLGDWPHTFVDQLAPLLSSIEKD